MKAYVFSPESISLFRALGVTVLLLSSCSSLTEKGQAPSEPGYAVEPLIKAQVKPFRLNRVRLLESPFKTAMELDARYLKSLEADRLLSRFREFAGLEPKAEHYGGWEAATISGHTLGHYLTAIAMLYGASGEKWCLERINYIVDELRACQAAWGNGFVGGFPKSQETFAEIKAGDIRTQGFDLNGLWVPWYTQHKLYMGLATAYLYTGNETIKTILVRSTDWAWDMVGALTDDQFETMLHCEHGGINEAFAEIYALTGYEKALRLAERFFHHRVLDPLIEEKDRLTGLHANTQFPKLIGLERLYQLTGKKEYHTAAAFFFDRVARHRSYVTGGNTDNEYFFPPEEFSRHLSIHTTESCNTYNMLMLAKKLFLNKPDCFYADFYERGLYNHILASQDPKEGMMTYFVPLKSGHFKTYNSPFDSFWCCTGTGMENHVKYGGAIYFHNDENLYINLFIPSALDFTEKGMTVTMKTQFPENGQVTIAIDAAEAVELTLRIRNPFWTGGLIPVFINKDELKHNADPGSYITIKRRWNKGDTITLQLPLTLRRETMPDDARMAAFFCGPVLLAGGLGTEGLDGIDPHAEKRTKFDSMPTVSAPVIVTDTDEPKEFIEPAGAPLTFTIKEKFLRMPGEEAPQPITLIPFYRMHYQRYAVYWDCFSPETWDKKHQEYRAEMEKQKTLEARTVDRFLPGRMQPEREHDFKGKNSDKGVFKNRHWRNAGGNGFFSFTMKVLPETAMDLSCVYWGSDGPGRDFDILVEEKKIATVHLNQEKPGRFFTRVYPIPEKLSKGKEHVRVTFKAHPWRMAGGLFECTTLKRQ